MLTHSFVIVIFVAVTVLSLGVTWKAARARPRQGASWLMVTMAGVSWWSLMELLRSIFFESIRLHLLFTAFHWIGVGIVAIGVLGVGLSLTGREELLTVRALALLAVLPVLSFLAWLGDPRLLDPLLTDLGILGTNLGPLTELSAAWDWLEWTILVYLYGLVFLGGSFVLVAALEGPVRHTGRLLLGVMILPPLGINVLSELDVIAYPGFDPTVVAFLVTGVVGIAAVDRTRLFDVPFARSQVIEQLSSPILVCGADHRLFDFNQAARDTVDVVPEQIDEDIRDVLAASSVSIPESVIDAETDFFDRLHLTEVETTAGNIGEETYLVETTPLISSGGVSHGYALQLTNITTQQRQRDRLETQNEQIEEFAEMVTHDLKNSLHVGMGRLDLVKQDCDSEHLDDIDASFDRMEALIDDLLDIAHTAYTVDEYQVVDLEELLERSWESISSGDASLVVTTELCLRADRERLRNLLENLLGNAVQHGPPDVTVEVGECTQGFYIADDGPGISEIDRERVFERRYSTAAEGTGLGLTIVQTIADAHGWDIRVTESAEGGARFEITGIETI